MAITTIAWQYDSKNNLYTIRGILSFFLIISSQKGNNILNLQAFFRNFEPWKNINHQKIIDMKFLRNSIFIAVTFALLMSLLTFSTSCINKKQKVTARLQVAKQECYNGVGLRLVMDAEWATHRNLSTQLFKRIKKHGFLSLN